jgi:ketosteroid isomerase-like protein
MSARLPGFGWCLILGISLGCGLERMPLSREADDVRLRAAVAGYDSAWQAKDSARVARYLASDYTYFTSNGGMSSLAESFGFLRDTTYRLSRSHRSELGITIAGTVARVSSRWEGVGEYQGEPVLDDQNCGQTWVWREARWQLFSEHCVNRPKQSGDN